MIDAKLAEIGNRISDIRNFLLTQEQSSLVANYEYLKQVSASVLRGDLGPEDVLVIGTQLEDIERRSSQR
jgi:hypothetical protein